jgi:hypothetical protein
LPRTDSAELKRAARTNQSGVPPKRDSIRREEDPAADATTTRSDRPERRTASWESEPPTGTRRREERSARNPVTIDDVGAAAVKIARARRETAPKLIATRMMIANAPIDTRSAFVLSLVDGRNSVDAIVDMSGMVADEVKSILARLARLGLITLP